MSPSQPEVASAKGRNYRIEHIPVSSYVGPNRFRHDPDVYYPVARGREVGIFISW